MAGSPSIGTATAAHVGAVGAMCANTGLGALHRAVSGEAERQCDRTAILEMILHDEALAKICSAVVQFVERHAGCRCTLALQDGTWFGEPPAMSDAPAWRAWPDLVAAVYAAGEQGDITEILCRHGLRAGAAALLESHRARSQGVIWSSRGGTAAHQVLAIAAQLAAMAVEHRQTHEDLLEQTRTDQLTRLPNRWLFEHRLEQAIAAAAERSERVGVIWLDLDRFKEINETLGHRFGDDVLTQAGARLVDAFDRETTVARTGGDEFGILLVGEAAAGDLQSAAARVCDLFRNPFQTDGYELFITASVGVAVYPDDGMDASSLRCHVDMAMYGAKALGRNTFRRFEHAMATRSRARLEIENSLRRALPRDEFELFYQPQVDAAMVVRGMEALIRWNHPRMGLVIPRDFVRVAEDTGLIIPIGSWVVGEACRQGAEWHAAGWPVRVAVNVSALQFYHGGFVASVEEALERSGFAPACLELELTESILMFNFEECARHIATLRKLGVTFALDDFGTGYSSLNYLQRLPTDTLKIDRSFLEHLDHGAGLPVVRAVTDLAHSLGLSVVAEGVEKQSQFETVRSIGIDLCQGYLFGKPVPAREATHHLASPIARVA